MLKKFFYAISLFVLILTPTTVFGHTNPPHGGHDDPTPLTDAEHNSVHAHQDSANHAHAKKADIEGYEIKGSEIKHKHSIGDTRGIFHRHARFSDDYQQTDTTDRHAGLKNHERGVYWIAFGIKHTVNYVNHSHQGRNGSHNTSDHSSVKIAGHSHKDFENPNSGMTYEWHVHAKNSLHSHAGVSKREASYLHAHTENGHRRTHSHGKSVHNMPRDSSPYDGHGPHIDFPDIAVAENPVINPGMQEDPPDSPMNDIQDPTVEPVVSPIVVNPVVPVNPVVIEGPNPNQDLTPVPITTENPDPVNTDTLQNPELQAQVTTPNTIVKIGSQPVGTVVQEQPEPETAVEVALEPLRITEYMLRDWSNHVRGLPQWIELYNPNMVEVDMAGYILDTIGFNRRHAQIIVAITFEEFIVPEMSAVVLVTHEAKARSTTPVISDTIDLERVYNLGIHNSLKHGWVLRDSEHNEIHRIGVKFRDDENPVLGNPYTPIHVNKTRQSWERYKHEPTEDIYYYGHKNDIGTPLYYEAFVPEAPAIPKRNRTIMWGELKTK